MKLLDDMNEARQKVFDYFGYVEDWVVIPLDDGTSYHWCVKDGQVFFADEKDDLINLTGNYYSNEIYTQRFLPKWTYVGKDYTMIVVDTHTDGNKFLQIFDNKLEVLEKDMIAEDY